MTGIEDVTNAVYDTLKADTDLSFIKKWFKGRVTAVSPIFPQCAIGDVGLSIEGRTTGRRGYDTDTYEITILVVQKDQSGEGYAGDGDTVKGITAMADDFREAIRVNRFGVFYDTARIDSVKIESVGSDSAGFVWQARFVISGDVVTPRNA